MLKIVTIAVVMAVLSLMHFACSNKTSTSPVSAYQMGSDIVFTKQGNSDQYKKNGWSVSEDSLTWVEGKSASLVMKLENRTNTGDIVMRAVCYPYIAKGGTQIVGIKINGRDVGKWEIRDVGQGAQQVSFDAELVTNDIAVIDFSVPNALRPSDVDRKSSEGRELGVAFMTLKLF